MFDPTWQIIQGDCVDVMRALPDRSVQTCVTSPPYFGLRDYGVDGQLGLEATPDEFIEKMVEVFREVRRVLRDDGTLWLNIGDSYAGSGKGMNGDGTFGATGAKQETNAGSRTGSLVKTTTADCKPKDLIGIPWMLAFALRADGWYLRSDIIWHKPNPMPESVTDRPTSAHEHVFLLSKSARYFYNADAIKEELAVAAHAPGNVKLDESRNDHDQMQKIWGADGRRNKRNVWTIATKPFSEAHFATFPPALVEPCILAGSAEGDTVFDPFSGSGTTGMVALRCGRSYVGIELNPEYVEMSRRRIVGDSPLFNQAAETGGVA